MKITEADFDNRIVSINEKFITKDNCVLRPGDYAFHDSFEKVIILEVDKSKGQANLITILVVEGDLKDEVISVSSFTLRKNR